MFKKIIGLIAVPVSFFSVCILIFLLFINPFVPGEKKGQYTPDDCSWKILKYINIYINVEVT